MKFLDALLGRARPVKSRTDAIFAMATAQVTMSERLGLTPAGRAGICFKPVASSYFQELERELEQILAMSGRETATIVESRQDTYGYRWVTLSDRDFEDLVNTVYLVSQELHEHGFGPQLLAALFPFSLDGNTVYWVYSYKRGTFYPFVPKGVSKQRDNALELRFQAIIGRELPVESKQEQWFPLWDAPV
ncbi:MAG: hypothetical protein GEU73_06940 [Chloroflexi bacterium]|nr:hypothetical protein [Chloroflexota bacterium]